jgi:hypothetical protein
MRILIFKTSDGRRRSIDLYAVVSMEEESCFTRVRLANGEYYDIPDAPSRTELGPYEWIYEVLVAQWLGLCEPEVIGDFVADQPVDDTKEGLN